MSGDDLDVVLYGATGYTGRLVAQDLADQGAGFAIAGRNRERLKQVADELDAEPEIIVASVDDDQALEAMASRGRTLASAAGPFNRIGKPVLDAALRTGTHFVDTTGEQAYLRWAADQDARAREAGATVINAAGFDVIPSDLSAVLAADQLDEVESVELALSTNSRLSDGTQRSMAASTGDWWEYKDGRFKQAVVGRYLRTFDIPGKDTPRTAVFLPWGDCVTAPRSTGAENVRTFFLLPPKKAKRYHRFWPIQALLVKLPFIDQLFEARAPSDRDGPDPEAREDSWFSILAEAESPDGELARAIVDGHDPYGLTGAATSRIALALARGEVDETGVMTPTMAFGPQRIEKMLPGFLTDARVLEG